MKTIAIRKKLFAQLIAVSKWYATMPTKTPDFYAGDRFHENVADFQHSCIPNSKIGKGMYVSHFEWQGKNLVAVTASEEGPEQFTHYKLIAKE